MSRCFSALLRALGWFGADMVGYAVVFGEGQRPLLTMQVDWTMPGAKARGLFIRRWEILETIVTRLLRRKVCCSRLVELLRRVTFFALAATSAAGCQGPDGIIFLPALARFHCRVSERPRKHQSASSGYTCVSRIDLGPLQLSMASKSFGTSPNPQIELILPFPSKHI